MEFDFGVLITGIFRIIDFLLFQKVFYRFLVQAFLDAAFNHVSRVSGWSLLAVYLVVQSNEIAVGQFHNVVVVHR